MEPVSQSGSEARLFQFLLQRYLASRVFSSVIPVPRRRAVPRRQMFCPTWDIRIVVVTCWFHSEFTSSGRHRQGRLGELSTANDCSRVTPGNHSMNWSTIAADFEILEESLHRHARSLEHPCPANLAGHALHCRTLRPTQHASKSMPPVLARAREKPGNVEPITCFEGVVKCV
jgi:hypothetical protein